jgi:hypothetical protein
MHCSLEVVVAEENALPWICECPLKRVWMVIRVEGEIWNTISRLGGPTHMWMSAKI